MKLQTLIPCWTLALMILSASASAMSLGVGPSSLYLDLERGSDKNQTFTVGTDSQLDCSLSAFGETAEWTTFYNSTLRLNPRTQTEFKARIKVPEDAPNGNYSGSIIIASKAEPAVGGFTGLSISPSMRVKLVVGVSGVENRSYKVSEVYVPSAIEKGQPLQLRVRVENNGNIWVKPSIVTRIYSSGQIVYSQTNDTITIRPPAEKELRFILQTENLSEGTYDVNVTIIFRDETLFSDLAQIEIRATEISPGEVVAPADLNPPVETTIPKKEIEPEKPEPKPNLVLVAAVIAVLIVISIALAAILSKKKPT